MNELYELAKDNNHMLKAIRRDAFVGGIFKFIFWVLMLVVVPYITWLFIEPYVKGVTDTYQSVKKTSDTVNSKTSADFKQIQDLIDKFTGSKN